MKYGGLTLALFDEIRERVGTAFQVVRNLLFGHKEVISSIEIKGDREFCEGVKKALLLLKEKDYPSFSMVNQNLDLVVQSGKTLLEPGRDVAVLALEGNEAKESTQTWLACLLACYGYQAKLAHSYLHQHKSSFKVPEVVYSGKKAWDFMYECLNRVGGSYEELQHLKDFIEKEREKTESK